MNPSTPQQAARLLVYERVRHYETQGAKEHRPNLIRHASVSPSLFVARLGVWHNPEIPPIEEKHGDILQYQDKGDAESIALRGQS